MRRRDTKNNSLEVCEEGITAAKGKSFFFQPLSLLKETIEGY